MAYGRYGYGGDDAFYSGPSPFEALVGEALSTFQEQKAAKLKRQQDALDEQRRQEAADRQETDFELGMREKGYSKAPVTDPNIVPNPTRVGSYIKTGMSEEELKDLRETGAKATARMDQTRFASLVGRFMAHPDQREAIYRQAVELNPEGAAALAKELEPPKPVKPPAPSVHGNYTVDEHGVARPIRNEAGRTVDLSPPTPKEPKDDRATWVRKRYTENLNATTLGGFGRLYDSPNAAWEATQREADTLFGPAAPFAPRAAKPVAPPPAKHPPTHTPPAEDVPSQAELEAAYKRMKRP